jgi:hypothetical protein
MVGYAFAPGIFAGLLWQDGVMTELGPFAPRSINDGGQIVGGLTGHGVLYAGGVSTNLDDLIPAHPGYTITDAYAINNAGWIAAVAFDGQRNHVAVLIPQDNQQSPVAFVISGYPSQVTAGTVYSFTVRAVDQYGNTVTGYSGTVHLSSSDSEALLDQDYTFTADDAGQHTFMVALETVGPQWLDASDTVMVDMRGRVDVEVTP